MDGSLPHIPDVERLSPRIIRVLGGNPGKFTLQGTNTYLLGSGPERTLIDTGQGEAAWAASLKKTLADEGASIATVLLTHWHPDHVGGVPDVFASIAPSAKLYKNDPQYLGHGESAARIKGYAERGLMREQQWGDIRDGQAFAVEPGCALRAVLSPGHTSDHVSFVLEEAGGAFGGMFSGDNVLGSGTTVFEDLKAYMDSLARMQAHFPDGGAPAPVFPAHGPVVPDGRAKIAEYIAHRAVRERQILRALAGAGPRALMSPMDIVKVVYKDVPVALHEPAEKGVVLVLRKLEADGTVEQDDYGSGWRCCR